MTSSRLRPAICSSRLRHALWWVLAVACTSVLVASAVPGAFSSSSANRGNAFTAGTVRLSDDDSGAAVFSLSGMRPGTATTGCIVVRSTGSLRSSVRLWGTVTGGLAPFVRLKVERGTNTAAFPGCSGFAPDPADHRSLGPGVLFDARLDTYPATPASGIADPGAPWRPDETHAYRLTATLVDDPAAQGLSSNLTFRWTAESA